MSEPNQEPTMEEILASIRRIISEDEAPADAGGEAAPVAHPEVLEASAPAPAEFEAEPEEEDEVLELTNRLDEPEESHGDIDVYAAPAPAHEEPPPPAMAAADPGEHL